MSRPSPYRILGVSSTSNEDEIKHAYRTLILKWHPDRHQDDKEIATSRFIEINNAYKELALRLHLESDFQEPFIMPENRKRPPSPYPTRPPSGMSTDSTTSSSESFVHVRGSIESESRTTPSSSLNGTHPKDNLPQSAAPPPPFPSHRQRQDQRAQSPTYENWRAGSDLPEMFRGQPYTRSQLPHTTSHPAEFSKSPPQQQRYPRQVPHIVAPGVLHESSNYSVLMPNVPKRNYSRHYTDHLGIPAHPPSHSPPYDIPLTSIGLGPSGEWAFSLPLTLEELFAGKHCHFVIDRKLLSGRSKKVTLELDIPPGCRAGTRILCREVGHQRKAGKLQDIVFIIDEETHHRFRRLFDDLIMDIRIPWTENLRVRGGKVPLTGLDGRNLAFFIDYPRHKSLKGRSVIKGAGMPAREGGKVIGRGDLVVQWEVLPPQTKIMHFVKRFWNQWR